MQYYPGSGKFKRARKLVYTDVVLVAQLKKDVMSKGHTKFDQWITFRLANASMILTGKLVVASVRGVVSVFANQRARGLAQKRSRMIRASDGQGRGGRGKW